ncbi:alanine dehydrogenase [Arachnia propionica]|uniref:Alanine dehydrogenase n=1 Tax=Arachnia propionica TaxID=1750 RepID=A0A3P1T9E3_9ACTN|nr:alanine dehydrogenase [Arachnia propionica]MDO5082745.1 alanine dehydrogenase [Arachnia propionica]RRD05989.1 alanine dehydrogenase [Arachnia propionica]
MRISVPKEIKPQEHRVAMTPAGVHQLTGRGHQVLIEQGAGLGSGITDEQYRDAGATIVPDAAEVWGQAELLVKVKEPIAAEYPHLRDDLVLFTYLHLAADEPQTKALLDSGTVSIAYETVQTDSGALPLLRPMSQVAGRLSALAGTQALHKHNGGMGLLVPGVPGVNPAKVVVLGGGTAGRNAALVAHGLRADVTILDINALTLDAIDAEFKGQIKTVMSTPYAIEQAVREADLVIGAVLVPGARAPELVSNELVSRAKPGSAFVDIAVDQGGCFADTRPTTHQDPTYAVHDSVFYAVANMPGAVPVTSTYALTNVTLPYVTQIADAGWQAALRDDPTLARGLSTAHGRLTNEPVASTWQLDHTPIDQVLE